MATRMHENLIFSHSMNQKHNDDCESTKQWNNNIPIGRSKSEIRLDDEKQKSKVLWKKNREEQQVCKWEIVSFVFDALAADKDDAIKCFTEHKVNERIFRADCSYRGGICWLDWVSVIWHKQMMKIG